MLSKLEMDVLLRLNEFDMDLYKWAKEIILSRSNFDALI